MGNEQSILYESSLDEEITDLRCRWPRCNGELASCGSSITVFYDKGVEKKSKECFLENIKLDNDSLDKFNNVYDNSSFTYSMALHAHWMKCLRHPSILKFMSDGKTSEYRYLVTERVDPLAAILDNPSSVELCSGLYSILQALDFIHKKAGVSHNNVCIDSIYVTEHGLWKLGELHCACRFKDASPDFLNKSRSERKEKCIPPEEKGETASTEGTPGHARDMFGFGVLYEDLQDYLEDLGDLTKTFELRIQDECLSSNPQNRPEAGDLLDDVLFKNDFLQVSKFLRDITLKSDDEKKEFFENLLPKLQSMDENLTARCLSHLLLCRFVLLDGHARKHLVPFVLTPSEECGENGRGLFSQGVFKTYVIPEIVRMFHCHDYLIRMVLLNYFSSYVFLFEQQDLQHMILPQLLLGMRDVHEDLAGQSLRCLADLVPILGRDIVIGGKSKPYFSTGVPKIGAGDDSRTTGTGSIMNNITRKPLLKDLVANSSKYNGVDHHQERKCINNLMKLDDHVNTAKSSKSESRILKPKKAIKHVHFPEDDTSTVSMPTSTEQSCLSRDLQPKDVSMVMKGVKGHEDIGHFSDEEGWEGWDDTDTVPMDTVSVDTVSMDTHRNSDNLEGTVTKKENILDAKHSSDLDVTLTSSSHALSGSWNKTDGETDWIASQSHSVNREQDTLGQRSNTPGPAKKSSKLTLKKSKTATKPKTETLGSEFEIKTIEIKAKGAEPDIFDFFSDMAPVIKNSVSLVDKMAESHDQSPSLSRDMTKKEGFMSHLAYSPGLTGENEEVTDGWDDTTWEDDGF